MNEAELQKIIADLLKKNNYYLYSMISKDSIDNVKDKQSACYEVTEFVEQKYIESVKNVLNLIREGNTSLLVDDGKTNITIENKRNESLRPDYILLEETYGAIIIIELKVDKNAERQAVTEVLAYQHEFKNYFPELSKLNLPIVIIAEDYKPLLRHSVYSLLMNDFSVLCLTVNQEKLKNGNKDIFDVVDLEAWHKIPRICKKENLEGYTLCLYPDNKHEYSKEEMNDILETTLQEISYVAKKQGSNGFAIAWKYKNSFDIKLDDGRRTGYFISIFCVNPYTNFIPIEQNFLSEQLCSFLKDCEGTITNTIDLFIHKHVDYLNNFFDVIPEGFINFGDWAQYYNDNEMLQVNTWGTIHEFLLQNVYDKSVKEDKHLRIDDPTVFFECIPCILGDVLEFKDPLYDSYRLGLQCGLFSKMSPSLYNYYYCSYRLSKVKWDSIKNEQCIKLFEYGKKFFDMSSDSTGLLQKCSKAYQYCLEKYNEKMLDDAINERFRNELLSAYFIEYVLNNKLVDETDEDIEQRCYELYKQICLDVDKKELVIQECIKTNYMNNESVPLEYKTWLLYIYAYFDMDCFK